MNNPTYSTCTKMSRRLPTGEMLEIEIRLKELPSTSSPALVDQLIAGADYAIQASRIEIQSRLSGLSGLVPARPEEKPVTVNPDLFHAPTPEPADPEEPERIPEESARHADSARAAFGHAYQGSPIDESWWSEPMTKTGGEGGGGQCKALNSALAQFGFKDERRHVAIFFLRSMMTGNTEPVGTLNILTKAEAHLFLDWFESAPKTAWEALQEAVRVFQPTFDDEDPFEKAFAKQEARS